MDLDEISKMTVEGLKTVSKTEVGISVNKRTEDTRVYTDVKEVTTTLKATTKCSAAVHKLEVLGNALGIQRSKEELKGAKKAYFRAVRMQKQKVHEQRGKKLQQMDAAGKSKMLHSMNDQQSQGGRRGQRGCSN